MKVFSILKETFNIMTVVVEPLRQCYLQESGANQDRLKSLEVLWRLPRWGVRTLLAVQVQSQQRCGRHSKMQPEDSRLASGAERRLLFMFTCSPILAQ